MGKYILYDGIYDGIKNKTEEKMGKYINLGLILFGVWLGVFVAGVAIVLFRIEEGFHPEVLLKYSALVGLYVDAVIFNIWLLRRIIEKITFFDNIYRDCRKCKNLMCVRKNKKIGYKCAICHNIMNSINCRKFQDFKLREKIVPVDRVNYIRKYAIIASIASVVLGVLLAILIPQGFGTGVKNVVFAEVAIFFGIFGLFAIIAMVVLWVKWWEWSDHLDKNKEEIIIFNEPDYEQREDNEENLQEPDTDNEEKDDEDNTLQELLDELENTDGDAFDEHQESVSEITKREIADALKSLEENLHSSKGYNVAQILLEMGVNVNKENMVKVRGLLRNMMSRKIYPEIKTAGISDIVYPPMGKNAGKYRLSKYRGK